MLQQLVLEPRNPRKELVLPRIDAIKKLPLLPGKPSALFNAIVAGFRGKVA